MTQNPSNPRGNVDYQAILRQLERLDERTQSLATKAELNTWRVELATKVEVEGKIALLTLQITRNTADIIDHKKELRDALAVLEKDLRGEDEAIRREQVNRIERYWLRFGPLVTLGIAIITLVELFTHFRIAP